MADISQIKISDVTYNIKDPNRFSGSYNDLDNKPIIPKLPNKINGYEYVDLGLPSGILWAKTNVGALSETDNGLYFSWGNTEGHAKGDGYDFSQLNYNNTSGSSVSTNITADSGYDAARVNMGNNWRMVTRLDFLELYKNCILTWDTVNDVDGYRMTSKTNGNSIFFPAVGYYDGTTLYSEGNEGYYWTSNEDSWFFKFSSSNMLFKTEVNDSLRGLPVRGVIDSSNISKTLHKVALSGNYEDLENKPTALPASDVSLWAKAATKPSYAYSEIGYVATAVNGSGALTLAGTDPIYIVTVTANISSVALTANPSAGHSCHVIFITDSNDSTDRTVAIAHDATNRVCPAGTDLSFTVPKNAGGYVEIDFLNVNNKVYVRGV